MTRQCPSRRTFLLAAGTAGVPWLATPKVAVSEETPAGQLDYRRNIPIYPIRNVPATIPATDANAMWCRFLTAL